MDGLSGAQLALAEALAAQSVRSNMGVVMCFYMGGYIDALLLGVVLAQVFTYSRYIRTDKHYIVASVILGFIGTIIGSVFIFLFISNKFVWNFGRYLVFADMRWLGRYTIVTYLTVLIVQIFYIDRACRLWSHWWPALITIPVALAALGTGLAFTFNTLTEMLDPASLYLPLPKRLAYCSLALTAFTDLLITVVIACGLYRFRTGWAHTNSVVRRLIIQSFEAQVPAFSVAIIYMITWNKAATPALTIVMLQTKIYVLGMLITLNLRPTSTGGMVNVSYASELQTTQVQSKSMPVSDVELEGDVTASRAETGTSNFAQISGWNATASVPELPLVHQSADKIDHPFSSTERLTPRAI